MSRFFVEPSGIRDKYIYLTDKNDLHHMKKVLRLGCGDKVDISDGEIWEYETLIEEFTENEAVLLILDKQKFAREPETKITPVSYTHLEPSMESQMRQNLLQGWKKSVDRVRDWIK